MTGGGDGGKEQDLWPDHCVQNTKGCEIEEGIMMRLKGFVERGEGDKVKIVRKVSLISFFSLSYALDGELIVCCCCCFLSISLWFFFFFF